MMGFAITYSYHIRYKSTQLCYTAVCADPTVWKKRCQLLLVPKVKKKRKNEIKTQKNGIKTQKREKIHPDRPRDERSGGGNRRDFFAEFPIF